MIWIFTGILLILEIAPAYPIVFGAQGGCKLESNDATGNIPLDASGSQLRGTSMLSRSRLLQFGIRGKHTFNVAPTNPHEYVICDTRDCGLQGRAIARKTTYRP